MVNLASWRSGGYCPVASFAWYDQIISIICIKCKFFSCYEKEENAQLMKSEKTPPPSLVQDHYTTLEVASMLGLAVRSVN